MEANPAPTNHMNGASADDLSDLPVACVLCQRIVSPDTESEDLLAISLCGDCKFLLLEEYEIPTEDTHLRTPNRVRRSRHGSSESIENFLSQQFSHMLSPATQSQPVPRLQTTPSASQRWRRVLSDTESDGFDSLYQESESNFSLSAHRGFQFEDSDASVDGNSDFESDIDIDPMRAGPNQWHSDDQEDDGNDENESEEEESSNRSLLTWRAQLRSPEFEVVSVRISERRRRTQTPIVSANSEEAEVSPFEGFSGDYLDARGFNELLERLAETDNSRQGAPPAAVSFVNTLPRLVINERHLEHDSLTCAICKDFLSVGSVVNQLPCLHFYHPPCILPWLRARNSCPLCRYELPTDDKDYEEGKISITNLIEGDNISSSDENNYIEVDEFTNEYFARDDDNTGRSRGRWLFLAAAPIMSIVGIVIVMWLKSPRDLPTQGLRVTQGAGSWGTNQRANIRSRRWWSLF